MCNSSNVFFATYVTPFHNKKIVVSKMQGLNACYFLASSNYSVPTSLPHPVATSSSFNEVNLPFSRQEQFQVYM